MRGRFAPSPSGEMHLGNASSALIAWLSARAQRGTVVLRVEDLDRNRSRPELEEQLLHDLRWLGLDWDEGPDVGGPHAPYRQSERQADYDAAFERLRESGRLYPCFCSRRDIAAAAAAPQEPGEERRYPGTCRLLDADEASGRVERGERHAWRFLVEVERWPGFVDRVHGVWASGHRPGDFVVHRSDGTTAYQLAVVVDDVAMAIDEVVRGDDLLTSTARQLLLYRALDAQPPVFGHAPLLVDEEGVRLSKRQRGITLRELREAGVGPGTIVGRLAALLGLRSTAEPCEAGDLVDGFELGALPTAPEGLVVSTTATEELGPG